MVVFSAVLTFWGKLGQFSAGQFIPGQLIARSTLSQILFEIGFEWTFNQHLQFEIVVEIQIVMTKSIPAAEKKIKKFEIDQI